MDEKTAALRDLFVDVTGEESVTTTQSEGPGTLVDDADLDAALADVVADLRAAEGVTSDLDDAALVEVVRRYYAGESDGAIAAALETDERTVFAARLDCHLLRESDADVDVDGDAARSPLDEGLDADAVAERLDADPEDVRRYAAVVATRRAVQRVNRRYRDRFEAILEDRDIAERLTGDVGLDALAEATADQEVDVDF